MKTEKIIITINDLKDIEVYKKLGIKLFAYPLKGFCVGIPNTFLSSDIPSDGYLFINRILDNESIDNLKIILNDIKIKGIIFDDLGVLELIKDANFEKILYLSHFNTNSMSIEIYLKYVDSVIVSTDITKDELILINNNFKNKLTIFSLGYVKAMYSRRLLIDNYAKFYHIEKTNPLIINNDQKRFLVYENEYGTVFYHMPLFNGQEIYDLPVKYYFVNSAFLECSDIIKLINNTYDGEYDDGFLNKETTYKLKGDSND